MYPCSFGLSLWEPNDEILEVVSALPKQSPAKRNIAMIYSRTAVRDSAMRTV
jgi:hypothetical protein